MGVWRGAKNWEDSPCSQVNNRSIFTRSGMREPMMTRATSCLIVFPVIQPIKEWVNQSGMVLPPFKTTGVGVEPIGSEKQIQCEGDRWEGAKIDQIVFPFLRDEEFFSSHIVSTCKQSVHLHDISLVYRTDILCGAHQNKGFR